MGLTAGEVEYILKLRDDLSAPFAAARQQAVSSGTAIADALKSVAQDSKQAIESFGASVKGAGDSLGQFLEHPLQSAGQALKETVATMGPFEAGLLGMASIAGASAAAIWEVTHAAVALGSNIQDMTEKTGISAPQLSVLRGAAEIAGSSLEQVSNAIFMMQRRMAEGTPDFEKGLGRINVSAADLKALDPAGQFMLIAERIKEIPDPAERAAAAMELFGRPGRDLLPLLMKNLDALVETSKNVGSMWTDHDAKAAEEFEMRTRALNLEITNLKINLGRDLIPIMSAGLHFVTEWGGAFVSLVGTLTGIKGLMADAAVGFSWVGAAAAVASDQFKNLPLNEKEVEEATKRLHDANAKYVLGLKDKVISETEEKRVEADLKKTWEDKEAAIKKQAELMAAYTAASTDYDTVLKMLGNDTYEGIAYDLERGASIESIAAAYHVQKQAVEDVKRSEDAARKALEDSDKEIAEHIKLMEESRTVGVAGMDAVNKSVGGGLNVLKDLSVAMGTTTIAGQQLGQQLGVIGDISGVAQSHMAQLADTIGTKLADSFERIPSIIQSALTGGGGLSGAAQAIGSMFGTDIGNTIKADLTATLSKGGTEAIGAFGKTLLNAIPVVGSLLGPAISGLIGLFHHGPSAEEIAAQKAYAGELQKNVSLFEQLATAGDKAQAATLANADWAKSNIIVTEAYVALGKTGAEALADLTLMVDGTGAAQAAAIDRINEATDAYKLQISETAAATKRYGFDSATVAQTLVMDWTLLQKKGFDISTVTKQMSTDINKYLQDAAKVGSDVPPELLPILQEMNTLGLLTDASGKKIANLGDISIESFGRVQQAIQSSTDKLSALSQAVASLQLQSDTTGEFSGYVSADQPFYTPGEAVARINAAYQHFIGRSPNADEFAALESAFIAQTGYVPGTNVNKSQLESFLKSAASAYVTGQVAPATHMAEGGTGTVTAPTLFLAGESGPEQYAFSGAGHTFASGPGSDTSGLAKQIADMSRRLPTVLALAVRDAIIQAGR